MSQLPKASNRLKWAAYLMTFGLLVIAALSIAHRDWTDAILAVGGVALVLQTWALPAVALAVFAASTGSPLTGALIAATLGCLHAPAVYPIRWLYPDPNRELLRSALELIDPPLLGRLVRRADGSPLDTRTILEEAIATDSRWVRFSGELPSRQGWDGVLLENPRHALTSYFAEAAFLAQTIADEAKLPSDLHLLATAAVSISRSEAEHATDENFFSIGSEMLGTLPSEVHVSAVLSFISSEAGTGMGRRMEATSRLPDSVVAWLPPNALDDITEREVWKHRLSHLRSALPDLLRAVRRPAQRLASTIGGTPRRLRERVERRGKRPDVRRPPLVRWLWQELCHFYAPWTSGSTAMWIFGRAALLLAGVVVAAFFGPWPWWIRGLIALGLLVARPARFWAQVIVIGGLWFASPLVAPVMTVRLLVTESVLSFEWQRRRPRYPWFHRLDASKDGRWRAQIEIQKLKRGPTRPEPAAIRDEVKDRFASLDTDEREELAFEVLVVCWSAQDPLRQLPTMLQAVFAMSTGRWPRMRAAQTVDSGLRDLYVADVAIGLLARAVPLLSAITIVAWHFPAEDRVVLGAELSGRVLAGLLTAVTVSLWVQRKVRVPTLVVCVVVVLVFARPSALPVLAACVATRSIWKFVTSSLEGRFAGVSRPDIPRLSRRYGSRLERAQFAAAATAHGDGRTGIGRWLLDDLAEKSALHNSSLSALALATNAVHLMDEGNLGDAEVYLRRCDELGHLDHSETAAVIRLAHVQFDHQLGVIQPTQGDLEDALVDLPPRWPARASAAMLLTQLHAERGDTAAAERVLSQLTTAARLLAGVGPLARSQTALARAYLAQGELQRAARTADDVIKLLDPELMPDISHYTEKTPFALLRGHAFAVLGEIHLESGEFDAANRALDQAVGHLATGPESLEQGRAMVLKGVGLSTLQQFSQGVDEIGNGLAIIERRRAQVRASNRRAAALDATEPLYDLAWEALYRAQLHGDVGAAGDVALLLAESRRRTALSNLLRREATTLTPDAQAVIDELAKAEAIGADEQQRSSLKGRLGSMLTERFAAVYAPREITAKSLRLAAGSAHIVSFVLPTAASTGWSVWLPPGGVPVITRIDVTDPWVLGILHDIRLGDVGGDQVVSMVTQHAVHRPVSDSRPIWTRVGEELLPAALRLELSLSDVDAPPQLVIIPDGVLGSIPWGAVCVDQSTSLFQCACVQISPALDQVQPARPRTGRIAGLIDPASALSSSSKELHSLTAAGAEISEHAASFLGELRQPNIAVAYMAAHGSGEGLEQAISLGGSASLGAAAALASDWPACVIFASCFVGRVGHNSGHEPLGIGIACLLRGAESVIGGVIAVGSDATAEIGPTAAIRVAQGVPAAQALRTAQLQYIETHPEASVADMLGLVCLSIARVDPQR